MRCTFPAAPEATLLKTWHQGTEKSLPQGPPAQHKETTSGFQDGVANYEAL